MDLLLLEFHHPMPQAGNRELAFAAGFQSIEDEALLAIDVMPLRRGMQHMGVASLRERMSIDHALAALAEQNMKPASPAHLVCLIAAMRRNIVAWLPRRTPARVIGLEGSMEDERGVCTPAVYLLSGMRRSYVYLRNVDSLTPDDYLLVAPR